MRVIVTRPETSAARTTERLEAMGHQAVRLPLTEPIHKPEAAIAGLGLPHAGLIVTSAEALRVLARPSVASRVDLDTPVYAVGEATAESARSLGFRRLHVGKGTGLELADLIVSIAPRDGRPLLYLAGRPRSRSLEDRLATSGREIRICEVYEMDAVDHDPADLAGLLGHPPADAVLLYSPDSAGRFFEVARPHAASLLATRFLCISRQAADRVPDSFHGQIEVADAPTEAALLALL